MTLDQAIQQLQELRRQADRDVEMIGLTDVDGKFVIDWERAFDLIELPCESCIDTEVFCEHPKLVCAYMDEPNQDQIENGDKGVSVHPSLRLV